MNGLIAPFFLALPILVSSAQSLFFQGTFDEALDRARAENKLVLVEFFEGH